MRSQGVLVFALFFSLSKTEYIRLESDRVSAGREGCSMPQPPVGATVSHVQESEWEIFRTLITHDDLGCHRGEKRISVGNLLQHELGLLHDPQRVHFGMPKIRAGQATEHAVLRPRLP